MKYELETTGHFKKDLKLIIKRGYNMTLLQAVVDLLCAGEPLPEKHKDHTLTGELVQLSGMSQYPRLAAHLQIFKLESPLL